MVYTLPIQTISTKEKLAKKDGEKVPSFIRETHNHFADRTNYQVNQKAEISRLQEVAAGNFDSSKEDYNYVTNPFNTKKDQYKKFPARLRNYDIITPIIERFMGERRNRPNRSTVYNKAPNSTNAFKEQIHNTFRKQMAEHLLLELQKMGYGVEAPIEEVPDYTKLKEEVHTNWGDTRAIQGQDILDYLHSALDLPNNYQRAYYHWLTTGFVFTQKEIHHDDVYHHVVNPAEVTVIGWDQTSRFAEDATAIMRRMHWSLSSVLEHFREKLTEDQIQTLHKWEKENDYNSAPGYVGSRVIQTANGTFAEFKEGSLLVEHLVWKTYTKRGILTYISPTGTPAEMPVDETYVLNKAAGDIKVEWTWEPEWWEIWAIPYDYLTQSDMETIYLNFGPGLVQRTALNNTADCKLPYNGTYLSEDPAYIKSITKIGLPYQQLYNIFHFYFERSLAKNKDKLMLFPIGLIPKHNNWTEERWSYFMDAFSLVFFDESADKAMAAIQAIKEIDMSLSQYMLRMWEFMQAIKNEWWEAVGFNPQRYGDIANAAGKGTTEQAIVRSAISSLEMISMFERFREKDEEGLLDYSKYAWIDGKKGNFVRPDGHIVYFEVNGIEHMETDYGVFVHNSHQEQEAADIIKTQILQPLAQNGLGGDIIAEVVEAQSMPKIKELLRKGMKLQQDFQMEQQKAQQQAQQQIAQTNLQVEQLKDARERDLSELKANTEIEKALIMADSFNAKEGDTDADGIAESQEIVNRHHQRMLERDKLNEQKRANMTKEQIAKDANQVKREDTQAKVQIAKSNKNKYDK